MRVRIATPAPATALAGKEKGAAATAFASLNLARTACPAPRTAPGSRRVSPAIAFAAVMAMGRIQSIVLMDDVPPMAIAAAAPYLNPSAAVTRFAKVPRTVLIAKSIAVRRRLAGMANAIRVRTRAAVLRIAARLPPMKQIAVMGSIMIATVLLTVRIRFAPRTNVTQKAIPVRMTVIVVPTSAT